MSVCAVQFADFTPRANRHAAISELSDQVMGHRLAQVGAAVKERDERASARERNGSLAGRVSASHDADALCGAELFVLRAGGVEDAPPLVIAEPVYGQASVFGPRGDEHGAGRHVAAVVANNPVALRPRLQQDGTVWRGEARTELARLDRRPGC